MELSKHIGNQKRDEIMFQVLSQIKTQEQFNLIEKLSMEVPLAVLKLTQKWDPEFSYFFQNNP